MTPYRTLAIGHQLLSLALAALVTSGVLASLEAQANGQHADAAQMAQVQAAQAPARS